MIYVSDKKGNLIFKIETFDKKVHDVLFKQLKKNKKMNVYERSE